MARMTQVPSHNYVAPSGYIPWVVNDIGETSAASPYLLPPTLGCLSYGLSAPVPPSDPASRALPYLPVTLDWEMPRFPTDVLCKVSPYHRYLGTGVYLFPVLHLDNRHDAPLYQPCFGIDLLDKAEALV